jgi:hypothetical protein
VKENELSPSAALRPLADAVGQTIVFCGLPYTTHPNMLALPPIQPFTSARLPAI